MRGKFGIVLTVAGGVLLTAAILFYALSPVKAGHDKSRTSEKSVRSIVAVKPRSNAVKERVNGNGSVKRAVRSLGPRSADWYEKLSPSDRALGKRIQDAQDADDSAAVFKAAGDALGSSSPEVRQAAVEAVSMQKGDAVLPTLQKFLSDADENVAATAYWAWDNALDDVEFEIARAGSLVRGLPDIRNEEHLETAIDKFQQMNVSYAIRELSKLAQSNDMRISSAARRAYENLTDEPWENWAKAELKASQFE